MAYDIRVEDIPTHRPLAVVRRQARRDELSRVIPQACGLVWKVLREQQIQGAGRHVAVYWDGPKNLEVGVEMAAPFTGHGEVVGSTLPAGRVASTIHLGPYQHLGQAHEAVINWCAAHGYVPAGPFWEIYGHWLEEWNHDPSKIRTDVCYLLKGTEEKPA